MLRIKFPKIPNPKKIFVEWFRKSLPTISKTEREALESGTVGWDGELMSGHPDWSKLFALKKPELTAEEQAFIDGPTEKLCKMLNKWEIQKKGDLSQETWDFMKKEGFFGLEVPKEYGGKGFSSQGHSAIVMKIASRSLTGAVTVMVPNSLGPAELIHKYGTKEQKEYYLPRLAKGDEVPCFALTGPDAGSDAGSIPDTGVVCKNEKGELGIRLNWDKRYITLAPVATLIGLAFKLQDPDNLLGRNEKELGITAALVPRNVEGIEIGDRHMPMDLPFFNGPTKGKDVFIPIGNIIGGPERAGQGWMMLMESLAIGRSISLPAVSVAGAQLASFTTGAYGATRRQFNSSISKFEGIEEAMGRIAGLTYMMNAARAATLQMVDEGERPAIPSAILKYHLTEGLRKVTNDAMDILGGKAVMNGPENVLADTYKGIPIAITVEGANIMTRNLIIFGQGAIRSHPYILKEMAAANDSDVKRGFSTLVKTLGAHVWNTVSNTAKSVWYGVTHGAFSSVPKGVEPSTKKHYREVNRLCAAFNVVADASLSTLGGKLKFKERTTARLGDIYSNLYLASTALWYFEKNGRQKEDLPLVNWACTHALHQAEQAMDQLLKNHPVKIVKALRPIVFPTGKHMGAPSDKMVAGAADVLRKPGAAFDRLTSGIYKPMDENEPIGKLQRAFEASVQTEGLEKILSIAVKKGQMQAGANREGQLANALKANIITEDDVKALKLADKLRYEVVRVDAFPQAAAAPDADEKKPATAQGPKR